MVKKATENLELAQELEKWARKFDSHNELTKKLVSDLETKNDLFKWAELDLFEFLPMPVAGKSHNQAG